MDAQGIYGQDINPDGELGNSIVPVELTLFTANVANNNITLNWVTTTELNNSGFEIERNCHTQLSRSMTDWEKIGFINGNGTTSESHSYSFADNGLSTGKYVYRLKQIDFDGTYSYSNEVEVDLSLPQTFSLEQNYPNPFISSSVIKYSIPKSSQVSLKIFNTLGEEIETLLNEEKPVGTYELNWNALNLPSGVYFYRIQAGSFVQTRKMILLK